MPRRLALLTLLWLSLLASPVRAHRLEAEYRALPDGRVQIECWYDLTGDSPKGARVQVYGADGRLLHTGALDAQGKYVFEKPGEEELKVVIDAGDGHRKQLRIPAPGQGAAAEGSGPSEDTPRADRSTRISAGDVMAGIGLLLAAAAFVLSIRNARRLNELTRKQPPDEAKGR